MRCFKGVAPTVFVVLGLALSSARASAQCPDGCKEACAVVNDEEGRKIGHACIFSNTPPACGTECVATVADCDIELCTETAPELAFGMDGALVAEVNTCGGELRVLRAHDRASVHPITVVLTPESRQVPSGSRPTLWGDRSITSLVLEAAMPWHLAADFRAPLDLRAGRE